MALTVRVAFILIHTVPLLFTSQVLSGTVGLKGAAEVTTAVDEEVGEGVGVVVLLAAKTTGK